MEHKLAREALVLLMKDRGIELTCAAIAARTDGAEWADSYKQTHYAFRVSGNGAAFAGEYSMGCHDVLEALRKGYRNSRGNMVPLMLTGWPDKDTLTRVLNGKARPYDKDVPQFREAMLSIAKRLPREPVDIFSSLLMDATAADQPFADWAAELGYSDDSIKAKATWETYNDIRRALARMLGDVFSHAQDLASEM